MRGQHPPSGFIAVAMDLAMMAPAQRDRELVAHFASEGPGLGEAQVMRIAWLPSADQARLLGNEPHMVAIANAPRFGARQHGLVYRW